MTVTGIVIRGEGDGKKLGYPTANIQITSPLELNHGVYACRATIDGMSHPGVLHYGPRLVFGETIPQFEVHLFDFSQDIYGKTLTVDIADFIRVTQQFPSKDSLVKQIAKDCEAAKILLGKLTNWPG